MSPELIDPQLFGLEKFCPTEASDCYAFGMVIYEIVSGHLPFHDHTDLSVFAKVLRGERPRREDGFTDGLWEMLRLCWSPPPDSRPGVEDVLRCLQLVSVLGESPRLRSLSEDENTWDSDGDSDE